MEESHPVGLNWEAFSDSAGIWLKGIGKEATARLWELILDVRVLNRGCRYWEVVDFLFADL